MTEDNSVATLIKANGNGNLLRHFSTMLRHKELKLEEKLCRDRRQLCRDTAFRVNIERQDNFVATKKFYVATNTT